VGGILFVSAGSGGERILSDTYVNFDSLRNSKNHFFAINTSSKDHERVNLLFKKRKIESPKNFHTMVIGEEELGGFGAGKDRSLGLSAYKADRVKVLQKLKKLHSADRFKIAFTLSTLGGGCGSLTVPEISKDIRDELGIRVIPILTIPFRREGTLLIDNSIAGLKEISKVGLNPLIYDNERMMKFSDSVKEGIEKVNGNVGLLIHNLVDLVEYGGFSNPPIDIIDVTRLIIPQCGAFSVVSEDNVKMFKNEWKDMLEFNLSLDGRTIENATAFVLFKSKTFPHAITEDVISYLRKKFKVRELIPTTLEDGFVGFNIMVMLWGLGIDSIKPTLGPKRSLTERLFSPTAEVLPSRTKI
jgi:cell division GTPase FtsZ